MCACLNCWISSVCPTFRVKQSSVLAFGFYKPYSVFAIIVAHYVFQPPPISLSLSLTWLNARFSSYFCCRVNCGCNILRLSEIMAVSHCEYVHSKGQDTRETLWCTKKQCIVLHLDLCYTVEYFLVLYWKYKNTKDFLSWRVGNFYLLIIRKKSFYFPRHETFLNSILEIILLTFTCLKLCWIHKVNLSARFDRCNVSFALHTTVFSSFMLYLK